MKAPAIVRLRERLGLDRSQWARVLGVNHRTVARWEDEADQPSGVAAEVIRGITMALEDGADAERVGRRVSLGLGALLHDALTKTP